MRSTNRLLYFKERMQRNSKLFSFMRRMIKQRRAQRSEQGILCILHNYECFMNCIRSWRNCFICCAKEKYGIVCCITTAVLQQIPMRIQACLETGMPCSVHSMRITAISSPVNKLYSADTAGLVL